MDVKIGTFVKRSFLSSRNVDLNNNNEILDSTLYFRVYNEKSERRNFIKALESKRKKYLTNII